VEGFAKNSERLDFVAACDPKIERAEANIAEFRKLRPGANVSMYEDFHRMLAELKPDIVTIATESGFHSAIAVDCLKAGAHVVCEKPMALSTRDANAMIDEARKADRRLSICFQNRFNPAVRRARAALEAGRFGRMLHGMAQVRWNRSQAYYAEAPWRGTWKRDGGTLMNQCTHGIDLLQWMMGEDAVRVQASTRRFLRPIEAEDFGAAIVEFASGAVGIIEGSVDIYPSNLNETLSLFGENGSVVIGGMAIDKIETWRFADADVVGDIEAHVLRSGPEEVGTAPGGYTALYGDFLDALEAGREPLISGAQGRKALDIILAIYQSQKTGRAVELPSDFATSQMASADLMLHQKR
jgi:predicted dehydrogenase